MPTHMTASDKDAYIAALRLLLGDRPDHDIIHVVIGAFPQFVMLFSHQLNSRARGSMT